MYCVSEHGFLPLETSSSAALLKSQSLKEKKGCLTLSCSIHVGQPQVKVSFTDQRTCENSRVKEATTSRMVYFQDLLTFRNE